MQPADDGMSTLWALLPATDAAAVWQVLTRLAHGLGTHDPRPIDARRADLLVDLLLGRLTLTDLRHAGWTPSPEATATLTELDSHAADQSDQPDTGDGDHWVPDRDAPDSITDTGTGDLDVDQLTDSAGTDTYSDGTRVAPPELVGISPPGRPPPAPRRAPGHSTTALVHVIVGYDTLTGHSHQPAELAGYGPIPADLARAAALDGTWNRLVTDPLSGALLDHGRRTYRPPAALHDYIVARDIECRFPTCRRRATDTDLDHRQRWRDGGTTDPANLHALCRHHHTLKEQPGWHVTLTSDGTLIWTTPTGTRHTSRPHDYRHHLAGRASAPRPATAAA